MLLTLATCLLANTLLTDLAETCTVPNSYVFDFDIEKYAGTWYELRRIPNMFENNYACEYSVFTITPERITVVNSDYNISSGQYETPTGKVVTSTRNSFTVDYINDTTWSTVYTVLGVDYSSYSIVAACLHGIEQPVVWVSARTPEIKSTVEAKVEEILEQYGYRLYQFEPVPLNGCPRAPIGEQKQQFDGTAL